MDLTLGELGKETNMPSHGSIFEEDEICGLKEFLSNTLAGDVPLGNTTLVESIATEDGAMAGHLVTLGKLQLDELGKETNTPPHGSIASQEKEQNKAQALMVREIFLIFTSKK
ncbi:hypothetical protein FACS1894122_06450 [Alphaproteobacteria bacterium]|nr:hypothetical protein FACS1894122_06450 [Alphaproteobacteria bacterium]